MKDLLILIRPKQWVKNAFVFAPLVFSGQFLRVDSILDALLSFALFCIAASAVYIVNDLKDIDKDREHPIKSKKRPLASGRVSPKSAILLLMVFYAVLLSAWFVAPKVMAVIFVYLAINWLYTLKLKHVPVIEIFIVAFGFVLRVYAGGVGLDVPVSDWMFITTLSISLYLASIKRRQELVQSGSKSRGVLSKYSVALVDRFAEMSAICAVVFYSLYVMEVKQELIITIPFVLFGLFRYWYIVENYNSGESPTDVVVQDWQILLTVLCWILICMWAIVPHDFLTVIGF